MGVSTTLAQPYPNRPIQLIIPNVPGAIVDINCKGFSRRVGKNSWHTNYSDQQARGSNNLRHRCCGKEQKGWLYPCLYG